MDAGLRAYIQQLEGELIAEKRAADERLKDYHALLCKQLAWQKESFERQREDHVRNLRSVIAERDAIQAEANAYKERVDGELLQLKSQVTLVQRMLLWARNVDIECPSTPQSVLTVSRGEGEGSSDNVNVY
jgi:hypothetical protein